MSVTQTRDSFFSTALADIEAGGVYYDPWYPHKDWATNMYMDCAQVPARVQGAHCTSWWNSIRCRNGLEGIGGTAAYNDNSVWWFWEDFNVLKNYPPFTVLIAPYGGPAVEDQGHKAVVYSWEDYETREQLLISSDAGDWFADDGSYGLPGPNVARYMSTSHRFQNYRWAGVIVDQPILDHFPGFANTQALERVSWLARCAEELGHEHGIFFPPEYLVAAILTENRPCIDPASPYPDIRQAPGYLSAVDHASLGPLQMQTTYWPMPNSFGVSVYCFVHALSEYAYHQGIEELPTDAVGMGETIQAVWRSFDPTGSNYAANHTEALELLDQAGVAPPIHVPKPEPKPDPVPRRWQYTGYLNFDGIWVPGTAGIDRVWGEPQTEDGEIRLRAWGDPGEVYEGE